MSKKNKNNNNGATVNTSNQLMPDTRSEEFKPSQPITYTSLKDMDDGDDAETFATTDTVVTEEEIITDATITVSGLVDTEEDATPDTVVTDKQQPVVEAVLQKPAQVDNVGASNEQLIRNVKDYCDRYIGAVTDMVNSKSPARSNILKLLVSYIMRTKSPLAMNEALTELGKHVLSGTLNERNSLGRNDQMTPQDKNRISMFMEIVRKRTETLDVLSVINNSVLVEVFGQDFVNTLARIAKV